MPIKQTSQAVVQPFSEPLAPYWWLAPQRVARPHSREIVETCLNVNGPAPTHKTLLLWSMATLVRDNVQRG